jgi:hypothetical protein
MSLPFTDLLSSAVTVVGLTADAETILTDHADESEIEYFHREQLCSHFIVERPDRDFIPAPEVRKPLAI